MVKEDHKNIKYFNYPLVFNTPQHRGWFKIEVSLSYFTMIEEVNKL